MSWSLGEIEGLAKKATRGAGYSWGLAEEAGVHRAHVLTAHVTEGEGRDPRHHGVQGRVPRGGTRRPFLRRRDGGRVVVVVRYEVELSPRVDVRGGGVGKHDRSLCVRLRAFSLVRVVVAD